MARTNIRAGLLYQQAIAHDIRCAIGLHAETADYDALVAGTRRQKTFEKRQILLELVALRFEVARLLRQLLLRGTLHLELALVGGRQRRPAIAIGSQFAHL